MKQRILWIAGIFMMSLALVVGIVWYRTVEKRENDPNWQIAKEIYKVENALQEVDEDYIIEYARDVLGMYFPDEDVYYNDGNE